MIDDRELSEGAAPTPTPLDALRTERLDDLRTIAAFAMAQGEDDVENAGIRVMLALDHPELLAASTASQPTSTPLDAVKVLARELVLQREAGTVEPSEYRAVEAWLNRLAASTASQPTSTPLDALRLCGCGDEPNERDCIAPDGILANGYVCQRLGTGRDRA
jgi:hypothetical protein